MRIRFWYEREEDGSNLPAVTHALVELEKGTPVLEGIAICCTLDFPVKEIGRKIALARAIQPLPKTIRKIVWRHYHDRQLRETNTPS